MARAKDAAAASGGPALTGPELEDALARGSFDHPRPQLVGMVKAASESGYVSFAQAGCESWVDVPTSLIAEAHHIGRQPCKDHSHPLFRLVLGEPTDPEAKALIGLLAARPSARFMPMPGGVAAAGGQGASVGQLRQGQCSSWCEGSTLVCACPVYVPGFGTGYVIYPCGTCINDPVLTAFA